MSKIYLISTVGISLLRACLQPDDRSKLFVIANLTEDDIEDRAKALVVGAVKTARERLQSADRSALKSLSAELNAILSYEEEFEEPPTFHHVLVVTDTFVGRQAADVLSGWLSGQGMSVEIWSIKDLRTARGEELRLALSGIVPDLVERIEGAEDDGWRVVFNLTGGFKGINGFLQTAAMLWASETVYLFEGSEELMHIPRIPVCVDAEGDMSEQFELFRELASGTGVPVETVRAAKIAGSLLFEVEGTATLSEWGRLIWKKALSEMSGRKLLASPHERIVYSDKFYRSVEGLPCDRMRLVNRAMERFAAFLNGEPAGRLNSLDFHPVKGGAKAPSTHQIDAWSDKDAKRIYLHEENGAWVVDELGDHQ
ncbi:MAG TPA: putative CRISPR-associated protein [Devosia sp.]|nr:putative CRISPR-associated protein [Devosia sp.]